jgi:hypothetical protein
MVYRVYKVPARDPTPDRTPELVCGFSYTSKKVSVNTVASGLPPV